MNILYYKNEFNMSIGFQFLSKSFDNGTINKISYKQIKTFLYLMNEKIDHNKFNDNDIYYIYINIFPSSGYKTIINDDLTFNIIEPKQGTIVMSSFTNEIIIFK